MLPMSYGVVLLNDTVTIISVSTPPRQTLNPSMRDFQHSRPAMRNAFPSATAVAVGILAGQDSCRVASQLFCAAGTCSPDGTRPTREGCRSPEWGSAGLDSCRPDGQLVLWCYYGGGSRSSVAALKRGESPGSWWACWR